MGVGQERPRWTFLTNHAHVLVCIARDPGSSLRNIAQAVGITERATQSIVGDLEAAGYLDRRRVGRRNEYVLHPDVPLRHPLESAHAVGELLAVIVESRVPVRRRRGRTAAQLDAELN